MDTRELLLELEKSFEIYAGMAPVRDVVLAGLNFPVGDYWPTLAIAWLEQGAELDSEIVKLLIEITAASRRYGQRTRHRALRLVKSWNRQH